MSAPQRAATRSLGARHWPLAALALIVLCHAVLLHLWLRGSYPDVLSITDEFGYSLSLLHLVTAYDMGATGQKDAPAVADNSAK